ncbi:MAG: arginine--tRNA ligase [Elusimicrobiota bacterium]
MILERLRNEADERLAGWARSQGWTDPAPAVLLPPPPHIQADVSLPWPMSAAKALRRKPLDVARETAQALAGLEILEKAEPIPPGFVNLRLKLSALTANLLDILGSPGSYGACTSKHAQNINLEFVSANPTGPVHLASGRAATLGDSLARILRRRGHRVATEYYVNDVGRQVQLLGLSVRARYEELHGRPSQFPDDGYHGDYIKDIAASAPAEASGWDAPRFSAFAVEKMLESQKRDMAGFGTSFDRWFMESELHDRKALDAALAKLAALGKVHDKDGATWLGSAESAEDDKDRVLVRSDGRPTYFLGDIAYHQDKLSRGFDRMIDIWGADHHGYVPRMKDAMAAIGAPKGSFHVIVHQLVHLFRGKEAVRMSKRAGEFIPLRDLVAEVGVDACRFFFAMRSPNAHLNFDIELAKKQSQENPVYYVQYVHARTASIFREAEKSGIATGPEHLGALTHPAERALLVKLARFPDALRACEEELSTHPLTTYLMELAGLYHPFYEQCRVIDREAPPLSSARLSLCSGVRAVIADGLGLLGVSAPERM